jgi:hypothetical protein
MFFINAFSYYTFGDNGTVTFTPSGGSLIMGEAFIPSMVSGPVMQ